MKTCQKPYKFDGEVKGQRPIGIMNVHNTSSHDDTPMCQICLAYVKPKTGMDRTRICKDRRTDGQTEWFLYTPLNFVHGGYKKDIIGWINEGM